MTDYARVASHLKIMTESHLESAESITALGEKYLGGRAREFAESLTIAAALCDAYAQPVEIETLEDYVARIIPVQLWSVWDTKDKCGKCGQECKLHYVEYNGNVSKCCMADVETIAIQELRPFEMRKVCDALMTDLARARSDARAKVAEQWLPIESAPKNKWIWCCHFDARLNQWFYYEAVTSTDDGLSWENNYGESCSPTHWQPLPPPPTVEGERG